MIYRNSSRSSQHRSYGDPMRLICSRSIATTLGMRSCLHLCISVGGRVPASGDRASFAQIRRQTCQAPPANAKPVAVQHAPDFVLSELTQPCESGPMESLSSESDAVREVRREGSPGAIPNAGCIPEVGDSQLAAQGACFRQHPGSTLFMPAV
jgi:hypothetical protein